MRKLAALSFFFILVLASAQVLEIEVIEYFNYNDTYNGYTQSEEGVKLYDTRGRIYVNNTSSELIADINILFYNHTLIEENFPNFESGRASTFYDHNATTWLLHIPELKGGEQTVWNYTVNSSDAEEPIDPSEEFDCAYKTFGVCDRILTFDDFSVNVTLKNTNGQYIGNITFTKTNSSNFNFTSDISISHSEGWHTYSPSEIVWSNFNLTSLNEEEWIIFNVTAPDSDDSGVYTFGKFTLDFQTNDTISQMRVLSVNGTGPVHMHVEKEREGAFLWAERPYFENPTSEINYTLNTFTVWSTTSDGTPDPGEPMITDSWYRWNLTTHIGTGEFWPTIGGTEKNFTTSDVNLIPIVWGNVNFTLAPEMYFFTENSTNETYIYYEKIMLIAGYFLKASKNITHVQGDQYRVRLNVTNVGSRQTPQLVVVADLIPQEFNITLIALMNMTSTNSSKNYTKEGSLDGILWQRYGSAYNFTNNVTASGAFSGDVVYYWNMTKITPLESVVVDYYLNGTGAFRLMDAFIVGLDPMTVHGYHASPVIKTAESIITETRELLILVIVSLVGFGTLKRLK